MRLLILLLLPCFTRAQKRDSLLNTVFSIGVSYNTSVIDAGTCFLVKHNGAYFIVTNYHVACGQNTWDNSVLKKTQIPNFAVVFFRDNQNKKLPCVLSLLDKKRNRLFYVPEKDSNGNRFDLAFIPINKDSIPKKSVYYATDISKIDSVWNINPSSKLFVYGFRGDVEFSLKEPIVDTVQSIEEKGFTYKDPYIFCVRTVSLHGSSGGPVYCNINNKNGIVGICYSETINQMAYFTNPELVNIKTRKMIYEFISISVIRSEFFKLLKSKNRI